MFTGLSSVGAMHLPSKVPSPPRCGGKISNGRKQVADIRQGKRVILTSSSLLKRIVILLIFTIFVHVAVFCFVGHVYIEKSFSVKEVHPPSRVNFCQREKKVDPFARTKSWQQRSHMLWLFCLERVDPAGQPKVSIYYGGKFSRLGGWIYHRKRVNERPIQGSPFTSSQPFCSSWPVSGLPSFCKEMYKKLARPGSSSSHVNLLFMTSLLHINEASDWSFSCSHWRFVVM